jgi:glycosyltransferase involved in cell wall biosynthesis
VAYGQLAKLFFRSTFFYKKLLNKSEVLTFLSPLNAEAARREFDAPVEFLPFGVSLDSFKLRSPRKAAVRHPTRIFTLGYDAHRDWETFAAAFGDSPDFEVRVASPNYPKRLIRSNMQVRAMDLSEVKENYAWADVIVVPLTKNLHAFGATVLFEAVILGVPVVISDVGGLRSYFDDDEVNFVPGADPEKLRQGAKSITESLAGAEAAAVRATAAQNRLIEQDYTSRSFARRHVAVSRPLLAYNHYESRSLADRGV